MTFALNRFSFGLKGYKAQIKGSSGKGIASQTTANYISFKSSSVARFGVLELSPTTIGKTGFRDYCGLKIILYALSAAEAKTQQQQQ